MVVTAVGCRKYSTNHSYSIPGKTPASTAEANFSAAPATGSKYSADISLSFTQLRLFSVAMISVLSFIPWLYLTFFRPSLALFLCLSFSSSFSPPLPLSSNGRNVADKRTDLHDFTCYESPFVTIIFAKNSLDIRISSASTYIWDKYNGLTVYYPSNKLNPIFFMIIAGIFKQMDFEYSSSLLYWNTEKMLHWVFKLASNCLYIAHFQTFICVGRLGFC